MIHNLIIWSRHPFIGFNAITTTSHFLSSLLFKPAPDHRKKIIMDKFTSSDQKGDHKIFAGKLICSKAEAELFALRQKLNFLERRLILKLMIHMMKTWHLLIETSVFDLNYTIWTVSQLKNQQSFFEDDMMYII